jgi:hypothetical protein
LFFQETLPLHGFAFGLKLFKVDDFPGCFRGGVLGKALIVEVESLLKVMRMADVERVVDLTLAVWTGLEPATPCVTGRYSNQLNYQTNFSKI